MNGLTPEQVEVLENHPDHRIFLAGPAGSGKTFTAVAWLEKLLASGARPSEILVLVPQRTLAEPYMDLLRASRDASGVGVDILTAGGLAQRMVDLFWPVVGEAAGFTQPDSFPVFLTLETAQYYMARLVQPRLLEGYFDGVALDRNRLYSQILDNLNKAAVVGFPASEIGQRLKQAWVGEPKQLRVYDDVQSCASLFRDYCLQHNLLDFSLQVEVFWGHIWPEPACRKHLARKYRHIIVDNLEEDTPFCHAILRDWLPDFDSALLLYDQQAGFRVFLGADPQGAYQLKDHCEQQFTFTHSLVPDASIQALEGYLSQAIHPAAREPLQPVLHGDKKSLAELEQPAWINQALAFERRRYYPDMLDWVAEEIRRLVFDEGVPPGEIVVLAPFLSDSLRFSLAQRLEWAGVPARSHRPSRSLRDEPVTNCLLTLACLAYPSWGLLPRSFDVAYALIQAIEGLDLVRAQLLAETLYRPNQAPGVLLSFDGLVGEMQERITFQLGERYERLRLWLQANQELPGEFDHFLSRLFGEVLSQPGFGFHASFPAGEVTANLIESIQKFRWVAGPMLLLSGQPLGKEYLHMVQDGVIAAQYVRSWQFAPDDAVLLAPAYTFLLSNRPVSFQFWLDIGSRGWAERLYQPLTHPYVLSRAWTSEHAWTDLDETRATGQSLENLVLGLLRRCRARVYLGLSDFSETGYEERGDLMHAFQRALLHATLDADQD